MCIWNCKAEDRHCDLCLYTGKCERVLRPIVEDNEAANSCVEIMSEIIGSDIRRRCKINDAVWARAFVAYKLRRDGYGLARIGRILNRHHATVINEIKVAENALSYPQSYADAINIWNEFQEKLSLHKTIVV